MGVAVRIISYSVTTTTPGIGSSITSMIVSSTGTPTTCLGGFVGAFLAATFDGRCFLAMGFAASLTLDFACFGFVRFAAFLRAGLALALPRLELFLRVATRFFALAMVVTCEVCRRQAKSWISFSHNSRHRIIYILRAAPGGRNDLDQSLLGTPRPCPLWVNRCREIQPQHSLLSVVSPIGDKLGRGRFVR